MRIQGIDGYQPGACNIGPAEIARRRRVGLAGIAGAVALGAGLFIVDAPAWTRLAVAGPLAGGLISLQQARRRFCIAFAMAGLRNFEGLGRAERVTAEDDLATDRLAAIRLATPPALLGIALAVVFALLPI